MPLLYCFPQPQPALLFQTQWNPEHIKVVQCSVETWRDNIAPLLRIWSLFHYKGPERMLWMVRGWPRQCSTVLSASTSSWFPGARLGKCEQDTELYLKLTLLPKIQHLSLIKYVTPTASSCRSSTKLFWTTYTLFRKGSLRESLLGRDSIIFLWYVMAKKKLF